MDENFISRLLLVVEIAGNISALSRLTGISVGGIRGYLEKGSEPTRPALLNIARSTNVSLIWLLTGEGPMHPNEVVAPVLDPALGLRSKALVHVPRYDIKASAGAGCPVEYEFQDGLLAFNEEWMMQEMGLIPQRTAVITVHGDSMEPNLSDGDFVLIDCRDSESFSKDAIYVFNMDGDLFVKRIQRTGRKKFEILSDNQRYKTRVPDQSELETLRIVGRVVWVGRRM